MSRAEDLRVEAECGRFLDDFLYPRLNRPFERNTTLSSQYIGLDVSISSDQVYAIDEKVKYNNCINEAFGWPGLEVTTLNRIGDRIEGWFVRDGQLTDMYFIICVFLKKGDTSKDIVYDNIQKLNVLMLPKKSVKAFLSQHGINKETILEHADRLLFQDPDRFGKIKYKWSDDVWVTYSPSLKEKPVNLVIPRTVLKRLPGVAELEVSRDTVRRMA